MINDTGTFSLSERFKKMSRFHELESYLRFLLVFVFLFQHSIPVFLLLLLLLLLLFLLPFQL